MARPLWCLAIGPDEAACAQIRDAAGPAVQVVAMTSTAEEARELAGEFAIEVAVIDERTTDAYGVAGALASRGIPIVWVGANPHRSARSSVPGLANDLPGALASVLRLG